MCSPISTTTQTATRCATPGRSAHVWAAERAGRHRKLIRTAPVGRLVDRLDRPEMVQHTGESERVARRRRGWDDELEGLATRAQLLAQPEDQADSSAVEVVHLAHIQNERGNAVCNGVEKRSSNAVSVGLVDLAGQMSDNSAIELAKSNVGEHQRFRRCCITTTVPVVVDWISTSSIAALMIMKPFPPSSPMGSRHRPPS